MTRTVKKVLVVKAKLQTQPADDSRWPSEVASAQVNAPPTASVEDDSEPNELAPQPDTSNV